MEEAYKNIDIMEIVEKYEHGADINTLAKYYGFPSTTILSQVLKRFYKQENKEVPKNIPIQEETKQEIYEYYYQGHSIDEISDKFFINASHINKILTEMRSKKRDLKQEPPLPFKDILEALESGSSLVQVSKDFNTSKYTIIKLLKNSERGQKVLEKFKKPAEKQPKREVTVEEIEEAYLTGKIDELHVWNWRSILQDKYGPEYIKILKPKKVNVSPKKEYH